MTFVIEFNYYAICCSSFIVHKEHKNAIENINVQDLFLVNEDHIDVIPFR